MIRLITVSTLLLFYALSGHTQTGITFNKDFSNAFIKARQEKKKVFIYFYADNCPACDYMSSEFANKSIGDLYNKSFVSYKYNGNAAGKRVAQYYGVYSFPTMLFVASDGDPVYSLRGAREGKEIFDAGKMARRNGRDIKKQMDKMYKDDKTDTDHLYNYIEYQMVRGNFSKANKLSKEYLNLRENIDKGEWMNFVLDYANDNTTHAHKLLLEERELFYKQFGKEIVDPIIWGSILYENAESQYGKSQSNQERAFIKSAVNKGYKASNPELRLFYFNYLFSDPSLSQGNVRGRDRDLYTKYALFVLDDRTETLDRETLIKMSIYLLRYHQKQSTMTNLNDALDNHFKRSPHYSVLDMQSVVLYSLGQEELAVEKIQHARELALKNKVSYRPSITDFRKQKIIK